VEPLRSGPRLTPLEEEDAVGAASYSLHARAATCPSAFGALVGRQLRALDACSIRSHGTSGLSDRIRSRWS
jgi:hypothetical protein